MKNQPYTIILCLCLLFTLSSASLPAWGQGEWDDARTLKFHYTHTRKDLQITYYANGAYLPGAMATLEAFLADWRNGEQHEIDPALMDILWRIQQVTGNTNTYEIISSYRSRETNTMLRRKSKGVAMSSQHLLGKAIDVRLRGMDLEDLRDTALSLKLGGVGYYAASDFVHVDTGPVRRW